MHLPFRFARPPEGHPGDHQEQLRSYSPGSSRYAAMEEKIQKMPIYAKTTVDQVANTARMGIKEKYPAA